MQKSSQFRVLGLVLFLWFQPIVFAQTTNPTLPTNGKTTAYFVPKDWKIAQQIEGDLNGDRIAETVLILQGTDQELITDGSLLESNQQFVDEKTKETKYLVNNNPYILAVLVKSNNQYQLIGKNNNLIPVFREKDSLYNNNYSINIENQTLIVEIRGKIPISVMDLFGNTSKSFYFQSKDAGLVLVKAQNRESSQAMLHISSTTGRRDVFEKYDFLKENGFFSYTSQTDSNPISENLYKINNLISFGKIHNDFTELKKIAKVENKNKKVTEKDSLTLIEYGNSDSKYPELEILTFPNGIANQSAKDRKKGETAAETEIRTNAESIKKIGESNNFKCEKKEVRIINWQSGSFTKKNSDQHAFLYRLCSIEAAGYAKRLGGIVITQKGKIKGHFVFSDVSDLDKMNVLPDINENGLNELTIDFAHTIVDENNFSRALGIFEVGTNGDLVSLGDTDWFNRIEKRDGDEKDDIDKDTSYTIFVKKGRNPIFYRESFTSRSRRNIWTKSEELTKFEINRPSRVKIQRLLPT